MQKSEYRLRRATRELRTRVAKHIAVDGGILEYLLRAVKTLSLNL